MISLAYAIIFLFGSVAANAQSEGLKVATWGNTETSPEIILDITTLLSPEQREIVRSGFTTFTLFSVAEKKTSPQDASSEFRVVCKVKYDTWEERYTTTKIEPLPLGTFTGNSIESWSNQCLKYRISNPNITKNLASGGRLFGKLIVRQSSLDEAAKIKEWLVKQQSGLMQGLYSHMLGDMQLGGRLEVVIEVPPAPKIKSGETPASGKTKK